MKEVGKIDNIGEVRTPKTELSDIPKVSITEDTAVNPFDDTKSVFDDIFKSFGLVAENDESKEKSNDSADKTENTYSDYLEKGEDGKYYDKETGKAYESVEEWVKEQKTLAKRYSSTADYYEAKAKKEWARFKSSEDNGESDAEKWEHYKRSQEYYAKAKECREKADKILDKIGMTKEELDKESKTEKGESSSFNVVPIERRECVTQNFENAPEGIKNLVNDLNDELAVGDTQAYIDDYGRIAYGVCHYSPDSGSIFMNPEYDDEEYAEVFGHEYGHFVDDKLGDISSTSEFRTAMQEDMQKFLGQEGTTLKSEMLDDLASTDAIYDRAVSDILSGMFLNDEDIERRYMDEGVAYYSHSNEYWQNGPDNAVGKEFFANAFRIYSDGTRSDSAEFIEKYFPNISAEVKDVLSV